MLSSSKPIIVLGCFRLNPNLAFLHKLLDAMGISKVVPSDLYLVQETFHIEDFKSPPE